MLIVPYFPLKGSAFCQIRCKVGVDLQGTGLTVPAINPALTLYGTVKTVPKCSLA